MREIKINFVGYYQGHNGLNMSFFDNDFIRNKYKLVIDDNPEYVFVGSYGNIKDVLKYPNAIRVFTTGEPISPNFAFFDYCIGFEPLEFGNRYCFFPQFISSLKYTDLKFSKLTKIEALDICKKKPLFADFVYRHETIEGKRKHFLELFSKYRFVESAGTYLNNQEGNKTVHYFKHDNTKFELQKKCKFSLCIQSLNLEYFINEKIVHAICNNEIPIFYGTDKVKEIFNPARIICVSDFKSDDELLEYVKKIDNDDELFAKIISEPCFLDDNYIEKVTDNMIHFIDNIFSNPKRRITEDYGIDIYLNQIKNYNKKDIFFAKHKILKRFVDHFSR